MDKNNGRYPYTYAADYIRVHVTEYDADLKIWKPTISRADAAEARQAIARALGMPDEDLAKKLADQYIADHNNAELRAREQ